MFNYVQLIFNPYLNKARDNPWGYEAMWSHTFALLAICAMLQFAPQISPRCYLVLFFANKMLLFFGLNMLNGFNQGGYVSFGIPLEVCVKFRFASYRSVLAFGTVFAVVAQMKLVMFGPAFRASGPQGLRAVGPKQRYHLGEVHDILGGMWYMILYDLYGSIWIIMDYQKISKNLRNMLKLWIILDQLDPHPAAAGDLSDFLSARTAHSLEAFKFWFTEMSGGWSLQHLSPVQWWGLQVDCWLGLFRNHLVVSCEIFGDIGFAQLL